MIKAFAANEAKAVFEPIEYDPGSLGPDEVELKVESCGICHSDLSMLNNDWELTTYPFVGGHEAIGAIIDKGQRVSHLEIGQKVGQGWYSGSCMTCTQCMSGDHNLCGNAEGSIVGRYGAFADKVRCHSAWVTPLPEGIDASKAGPLFCGGVTVFTPLVEFGIQPTDRVGVVGIGGLGHLALQYFNAWGCEVTAFSNTDSKEAEAKKMGAHHFVATHNVDALAKVANTLDFILVTVNVPLDWVAYLNVLRAKGKLHVVGVVPDMTIPVVPLLFGQKSLSSSPVGNPINNHKMIEFAARHNIEPITEHFKMSQINEAFEHLRSGNARYRIVLDNDF